MSSEGKEKRSRCQNTFNRVLARLSDEKTLKTIAEIAKKTVGTKKVYMCESTGIDDGEKLFFVVDTPDKDEENFTTLGSELENLHGHREWLVVRKQSVSKQQFERMYINVTPLFRPKAPECPEPQSKKLSQSK